ncbi:MAG: ABC transporter permease [Verrucomicrobiota bacterium]
MNVFPVISRELRAQARQPFTFWLRIIGVAALLVCGLFFTLDQPLTPNRGAALFGYMHLTLFSAVWILVPFSAADCLSRERREGTLGLLFLTPLKPRDIVVAKGLSHGLRAITLLVAVVPVLTIPFLLGGVTWQQAFASAIINFEAICWALGAALVVSATSRTAIRALAMAMLLTGLGLLTSTFFTGALLSSRIGGNWSSGYSSLDFNLLVGFAASGLHPQAWNVWTGAVPRVGSAQVLTAILQSAIIAVFALAAAVLFAANRVRTSWQEEPPSIRRQQIEKVFFQPVIWVSFLNRWMRWKLERNPIGWLEQRRWSGRLVTWTWFAVIVSVQSTALTDRGFFRSYGDWENFMAWLLVLSMAASAAGSFRRERETGVLELLLVSPLKTSQIIGGRLRGLWGQFLPSIILLLGVWIYFAGLFEPADSLGLIWFFLVTYLVVPVIGLYFSVSCRHFITAFLFTLITVVLVPGFLILATTLINLPWGGVSNYSMNERFMSEAWAIQCGLAALFGWRLYRRLQYRSFPLERGVA